MSRRGFTHRRAVVARTKSPAAESSSHPRTRYLVPPRTTGHFCSMSDTTHVAAALDDRYLRVLRDYRADAWMSKVIR